MGCARGRTGMVKAKKETKRRRKKKKKAMVFTAFSIKHTLRTSHNSPTQRTEEVHSGFSVNREVESHVSRGFKLLFDVKSTRHTSHFRCNTSGRVLSSRAHFIN